LRSGLPGLFLAVLETYGQRDTEFCEQIQDLYRIRDGSLGETETFPATEIQKLRRWDHLWDRRWGEAETSVQEVENLRSEEGEAKPLASQLITVMG